MSRHTCRGDGKEVSKNLHQDMPTLKYDHFVFATRLTVNPSAWEVNIENYMEYLNKKGYRIPLEFILPGIESARTAAISADIEQDYDASELLKYRVDMCKCGKPRLVEKE